MTLKPLSPCLLFCTLLQGTAYGVEADDFIALFNGKDFTGWKLGYGGAFLDGKTDVKNNRIRISNGLMIIDGKKLGILLIETKRIFDKDVTIRFEFLPNGACNHDLYFRGNKFDIKRSRIKNLVPGKWHQCEIIVRGGRIELKCNGQTQKIGEVKKPSSLGIRAEQGAISFRKLRYKE